MDLAQVDVFPNAEPEKVCVRDVDEIFQPDPTRQQDPQAGQLCFSMECFCFKKYSNSVMCWFQIVFLELVPSTELNKNSENVRLHSFIK